VPHSWAGTEYVRCATPIVLHRRTTVLENGSKARRQIATTTGFQLVGRGRQVVAAQDIWQHVRQISLSPRSRPEIGIRMALGAPPADVVRLVLARVAMLVGIGVVIGAGVSLWASKFVATLLYDLEPRDPIALVCATLVLGTVGAAAGWLPACRASHIDPAEVLRES
jgi:predicted lysophospholipase L1 biosynthesis ABC-type transport system permease subunit